MNWLQANTMSIHELIRHLNNGQQADADGVMVTVSRHAVVEAIRLLNLLGETNEALAACQSEGAAWKRLADHAMAIRKQKRIEELTEQVTECTKMLKVMPCDGLSAYEIDTWKRRRSAFLALFDRPTVSAPTGAGGNAKAFVCCEGVDRHADGCTTVTVTDATND